MMVGLPHLIQSHDMRTPTQIEQSDRRIRHVRTAPPYELEEAIEEGPVTCRLLPTAKLFDLTNFRVIRATRRNKSARAFHALPAP